ncbi:MAG: hypothetical protein WDN24_02235 [Sphingomonas sp.]
MTTQSNRTGRKPTHRLYHVTNGDKPFWTAIGAAWPNKDGKGFTLACDAVPLEGRIVMRAIKERIEDAEQGRLV